MELPVVRPASLPHVARALEAMRREPARPWTVRELARRAGMSRAAFARRFKEATGVSPLRWLAEHRLTLAADTLRSSGLTLARVGLLVGYACEFAFAKAFKRLYGLPPGEYRRRARVAAPTFRAAA